MRSKYFSIGIIGLVSVIAVGLMAVPAVRESQTQDEAVYVVSGLSYWRTGDYRLNPEHPPLMKLVLGLPLVAAGVPFQPDQPDWDGASQWDIAPKTLYGGTTPGHNLLVSARAINVVLTIGLIVLLVAWAWRTFGRASGVVVGSLAAFEPNLLANGHLATTDIGGTLAVLASIFTFGLWLERPSLRRLLIAAVIFSLALLTRFNALILVLVLPALYLTVMVVRRGSWSLPRRVLARAIAVFLLTSFCLTWAAYGLEVRRLDQVQDQSARNLLVNIPAVSQWLQSTPLPSMSYLSGLLWQVGHNRDGQWAYLFGRISHQGWWYYFPVALIIKMTVVSLVLIGAGLFFSLRKTGRLSDQPVFSSWFLLIALVGLTLPALTSHLNLGVRYVLPSLGLMLIFVGGAVRHWGARKWVKPVVTGLVIVHIISVVRFFPHWLPYSNEIFGGPAKLDRYLIDSNLDWGQDMPLVREYLADRGIEEYRFQAFSTAPASAYGLVETVPPTDAEVSATLFRGVVVIGKSVLYYPNMKYEWLRALQPTDVLGYSTNVYDLR